MNSIVLDLQNEVTKPNCDIVNVLRKAHLIAVKLGLKVVFTCKANQREYEMVVYEKTNN